MQPQREGYDGPGPGSHPGSMRLVTNIRTRRSSGEMGDIFFSFRYSLLVCAWAMTRGRKGKPLGRLNEIENKIEGEKRKEQSAGSEA